MAAGGTARNPKGREIGFGRGIRLTDAGRKHPMYVGKAEVFNAPTVHLDEVETLAPGTTVLATNACPTCRREIRITARSLGRCSTIRNIRCAKWPRSCAASARG